MKSRIIGILIILILTIIIPYNVFAGEVGYNGIDTNIAIGNSAAAQSSADITNRIVGVLQVAGTVIAVLALIIIGMRYMFSSIQERAQMKGVLGYYIIGCILVFATSNVLAFVYDVVKDVPHSYGEMYAIVPSTCTSQGTANRKCTGKDSLCNCTESEPHVIEVKIPINPDAHNMGNWIVEKDKTCTEDGIETRICVNGCGKKETRAIAKLGHNYEYGTIRSATCTVAGYEGNKCTRCGDEKDTTILVATGHSKPYNSEITTHATCTTDGVKTYTCKNGCGDSYTEKIAATGHSKTYNSTTTIPATCTTEGVKTYTCKNGCGDTYTETIAANGHKEVTLSYVAATCTTAGKTAGKKCSVCNTVLQAQTTIAATGHKEKTTISATAATCTKNGKTAKIECSVCKTVLQAQTDIPATGHSEVTLVGVAATCTTPGITDGKRCSVCGVTTQAQTTIPAGHPSSSIITFYLKEKGKNVHGKYEACKDCGYPTVTDEENCNGSKGFLGIGKTACTICGLKDNEGRTKYSFVLTSQSHTVYVDWNWYEWTDDPNQWWRWEPLRS